MPPDNIFASEFTLAVFALEGLLIAVLKYVNVVLLCCQVGTHVSVYVLPSARLVQKIADNKNI